MAKAVFIHNGSGFYGSAQGPTMVKPHSWKGGTPWPAIGAGSQPRTLSIKTLRCFVKSLALKFTIIHKIFTETLNVINI